MEKAWVNKYEQILADLFRNYQQQISNSKIGVLVSGGIDSSLIACLVNKHFPDSYLISLQSEKSVDDDFVAILSQFLKKNPFLVQVTRENLLAVQDEIKQLLNKVGVETNPMQMALASVYYWLFKAANKKGIKTKPYLPCIHLQPAYVRLFGYKKGDFPKAEKQAEKILSLPIYPELKEEQLELVVKEIRKDPTKIELMTLDKKNR